MKQLYLILALLLAGILPGCVHLPIAVSGPLIGMATSVGVALASDILKGIVEGMVGPLPPGPPPPFPPTPPGSTPIQ